MNGSAPSDGKPRQQAGCGRLSLDEILALAEHEPVDRETQQHLETCPPCRDAVARQREVRALLRSLPPVPAPPALLAGVRARMEASARTSRLRARVRVAAALLLAVAAAFALRHATRAPAPDSAPSPASERVATARPSPPARRPPTRNAPAVAAPATEHRVAARPSQPQPASVATPLGGATSPPEPAVSPTQPTVPPAEAAAARRTETPPAPRAELTAAASDLAEPPRPAAAPLPPERPLEARPQDGAPSSSAVLRLRVFTDSDPADARGRLQALLARHGARPFRLVQPEPPDSRPAPLLARIDATQLGPLLVEITASEGLRLPGSTLPPAIERQQRVLVLIEIVPDPTTPR